MNIATKAHRARHLLKALRFRIFLALLLFTSSLFILSTCLTISRYEGTLQWGMHGGSFRYHWLHAGPVVRAPLRLSVRWHAPMFEGLWPKFDIPSGPMLRFGEIIVPLWLPIPLAALGCAPFLLLKRKRPNVCHRCGYSRLGLRKEAVCPECGATFSQPQPQP